MILSPTSNDRPGSSTLNIDTPQERREQFVLSDAEVHQLAHRAVAIEEHDHIPVDLEWAKDGLTRTLYIAQARPETVHSNKAPYHLTQFALKGTGTVLVTGSAVGSKIPQARCASSIHRHRRTCGRTVKCSLPTSPTR